ncbi:DNA replication and repair protein RecF [Veillonellaceae bacterium DNF00626]|nr:DNA replication and repair protein RecF [Veillonellaceae bacterium DNF00626]
MKCKNIKLIHFRNFFEKEIDLSDRITILQGNNGVGKTNIIEAVYVASIGKSFRATKDEEMIQMGENEGTILLSFVVRETIHEVKIKLFRDRRKKMYLNDTEIKRKDWLGFFRTVLFTPDELQLIKGAPYERRRFLDVEISQINPRYYEEIVKYNRAVQQRNYAFKNAKYKGFKPEIDIWDMQIAKSAAYIVRKRKEAILKMNEMMKPLEEQLTGAKENLLLAYKKTGGDPDCFTEEWYLKKLAENREEDSLLFHTSVGPHRDDFIFQMNGFNLAAYGSQGQQRTAIVAMKLAEIKFIKKETGEYPVLLLDDIHSELDEERKKALFSYLSDNKIQTIITTAEKNILFKGNIISL